MLMTFPIFQSKRPSERDAVDEARGTGQNVIDQARLSVHSVLLITFYMRRFTRYNPMCHLAVTESTSRTRPDGVVESAALQQTRTRFSVVPAHDPKIF